MLSFDLCNRIPGMIGIIGETCAEFYPADLEKEEDEFFSYALGGTAVEAASELTENGIDDFLIITKLSRDNIGLDTLDMLSDIEWSVADLEPSPLLSPVDIMGDIRLRGTAAATIGTEELTALLADVKPEAVLITAPLLSVNPSASSIVDSICFMNPQPKVIVDLGNDSREIISLEILRDSLNAIASSVKDSACIGEAVVSRMKVISRENAIAQLKMLG